MATTELVLLTPEQFFAKAGVYRPQRHVTAYHGSTEKFRKFDIEATGYSGMTRNHDLDELGLHFGSLRAALDRVGDNSDAFIYEVDLRFGFSIGTEENPFTEGEILALAAEEGFDPFWNYDVVIYTNDHEDPGSLSYAMTYDRNIKIRSRRTVREVLASLVDPRSV